MRKHVSRLRLPYNYTPILIAFIYLLVSVLWIVFSDRIVAVMVVDPQRVTELQTFKGLGFVFASALLLYFLIRSPMKKMFRSNIHLAQAEEKLRLAFESVSEGITITDQELNVIQVNEAVVRMHGYDSKDDLIGRNARELIVPADHTRAMENMTKTMETGQSGTIEYTFLRRDGSEFPAELSAAILRDASGKPAGFIAVTQDITERKKTEEHLIVTDRLATIGELIAGVAHELNNPLTSIIGFSQLLLDRDVSDDVKEDLKTVYKEAERTSKIVKNLLTFARRREPKKEKLNIIKIIDEVLQLRAYEHKVHDIRVNTIFASDIPEIVADGFQLQQVFLNIIINAEYFMIKTHGKGNLTIAAGKADNFVRVSIADDGPGIAKEHLGHLFDPFFPTKEVGKGTGLGLSICHGIIAEHSGQIYAESRLGKGATFIVELPITQ